MELPTLVTLSTIGGDLVALAFVIGLYSRRHGRRDVIPTMVCLNVGAMAIMFTLSSSNASIGVGLGLLGVLSIIRLRSTPISQIDIAYYFSSLVLGLLAGLATESWLVFVLMAVVIVALFVGDRVNGEQCSQLVTYDRAITDERELILAIEQTIGARINDYEIVTTDLVNDLVKVQVSYTPTGKLVKA